MTGRTTKPSARARRAASPASHGAMTDRNPVLAIAAQLRSWADTVLGVAVPASDAVIAVAKSRARTPKQKAAIEKAGALLRKMRETAGMSARELGRAVDLGDPVLIEQAESGKVALPFEVILRVAAVLGRNDPISSALKLTRAYNPDLWKVFEDLGIGRLVVQAGRERELANIYRANDAARRLSDADFADVLRFAKTAFDMAVTFRIPTAKR